MILADARGTTRELFPVRAPETSEAMTPEESDAFSEWHRGPVGRAVYAGLADLVLARIGAVGGRLLSVGDGEGLLSAELARLVPHVEVVATDLCPEVVARAGARHRAPNLRHEVASVYDLARHAPAQVVVCAFALHHFGDAARGLAEMRRALAPGGRLVVIDLRRDAAAGPYFRRLDGYVGMGALVKARLFRESVAASYTQDELRDLLGAAALRGDVVTARGLELEAAGRSAFARGQDQAGPRALLGDLDGLVVEGHIEAPG